jgi:hypothetical protein
VALPWFLLVGGIWAVLLLALVGRSPGLALPRRTALAVLGGGWAAVAGMSGLLLLGAWIFTDHFFWYRNYNLFQLNPLGLILAAGFAAFAFRGRLPAWARRLGLALAGLSAVGVMVQLLPGLGQRNLEILAVSLPVNLAVGWACLRLGGVAEAGRASGP